MLATSQPNEGHSRWRLTTGNQVVYLASFGYACFIIQQVSLDITLVCMVNHTSLENLELDNISQTNVTTSDVEETDEPVLTMNEQDECALWTLLDSEKEDGELVWTKETQGLLISSLYWGYFLLQIPAQTIIEKTGAKNLALTSVLAMSVLSMLIPVAAITHIRALMCIRIIQGMAMALGVPALYAIWGDLAPKQLRASMLTIVFTGGMFMDIWVHEIIGLLCYYGFAGGWPSVFYVFALIGVVWCVLWAFFFYETPASHPHIDSAENNYAIRSMDFPTRNNAVGSVPWWKLLTSMPVWAVAAATISYTYPLFTFMAVLPQYMEEILIFDFQWDSVYMVLPYLVTNCWAFLCSIISNRNLLSVYWIQKLSAIIGCVVPNAVYITISFLDCTHDGEAVAKAIYVAIAISGFSLQCYLVNPYDIAPRYATAIFCLSNTISIGMAIISPYVVAALKTDETREQWQLVFFSTVGVSIGCLIFYLIFGSAQEMDWVKGDIVETELAEMEAENRTSEPEDLESRHNRLMDERNFATSSEKDHSNMA